MNRRKVSRLRQQLLHNEQARERHVQTALSAGTMIEGACVTRGRKCGKPNCRCATGDKHYSKFVARSEAGRPRFIYVPAGDEVDVASKTEAYRRVRQARAQLMKLAATTAELIDELVRLLTEPYNPQPRKRRGSARRRKPKSEDGSDS